MKTVGRWAKKASHRRKIKKSRLTKETIDPIEETAFQQV